MIWYLLQVSKDEKIILMYTSQEVHCCYLRACIVNSMNIVFSLRL